VEVEDLLNEGLLTLSVSARRYMFFCSRCGSAHLDLADFRRHSAEVHRVLGDVPAVSLLSFCETSAALVMRRVARNGLTLEAPTEDLPALLPEVDLDAEERVFVSAALAAADRRVMGGVENLLSRILRVARTGLDNVDVLDLAIRTYPHLCVA